MLLLAGCFGWFADGWVYCWVGCCVGFVLLAFAVSCCCVNNVDLVRHCSRDWFVWYYAWRIVWLYLVRVCRCAGLDCWWLPVSGALGLCGFGLDFVAVYLCSGVMIRFFQLL